MADLFNGFIDWIIGIINAMFGGAGSLLTWWLGDLGLNISLPDNIYSVLHDVTYCIGYIFPVRELVPIPAFMLSFYIARAIFALFKIIASTVIKRVKVKV